MKKIIAILLSVLCVFSLMSTTAFAADDLGGILGDIIGLPTEEDGIDQQMSYGIHYEMETLSVVSIMYKPNPTITFEAPTTAKITSDTPLSVDYEFVCWRHADTGEYLYPGDEIDVTGKVTLYAVWEEKTDGNPRVIRVIMTALETLGRLIQKFLGIIEDAEEFESEYYETTVPVVM